MEELDLNNIRSVFPNWPSELDVAKQEGNWFGMAQAFHCAAIVLHEEDNRSHQNMHAGIGGPVDRDVLIRAQVGPVAMFCSAFSLELAIKATLVKQGALDQLQSGERLPFSSHALVELASNVKGLQLSEEDIVCLKQACAMISTGKYPTGVRPDASANGVRAVRSFDDFAQRANDIYDRLMELATAAKA